MEHDSRLVVPEQPLEMQSGVLTELWSNRAPLPTIRGMEVLGYYLQRGFHSIFALPMSSAITISSMGMSLFLLAGFLLLLQNADRIISTAGTTLTLTAYIKEDADPAVVKQLAEDLKGNTRVRSLEYVSKQDALFQLRDQLGPRSSFLQGLEADNPLPASFEIALRPDDVGTDVTTKLVRSIQEKPVIEEVVYGSEWAQRMQGVLKVFRLFGFITLLFALGVVIFLIANTIKLVIYSRRDEITIMQLVGASDRFIRMPFIIGGLFQGLTGSLLGLLLLRAAFFVLTFELGKAQVLGASLPQFDFLSAAACLGIVLVGLAVGAIGSFLALGRFMNV